MYLLTCQGNIPKQEEMVLNSNPRLSFNITDINITTQNRNLTCLHDSPGVGGSDGLNVSKPSASGGQAKPDLGHLLSPYQPQSKTGPATAQNLRSKNKINHGN